MKRIPYIEHIPFTGEWAKKRASDEFDRYFKNREVFVPALGKVKPVKVGSYDGLSGHLMEIIAKKNNKRFIVDIGKITAITKTKLKKVV